MESDGLSTDLFMNKYGKCLEPPRVNVSRNYICNRRRSQQIDNFLFFFLLWLKFESFSAAHK